MSEATSTGTTATTVDRRVLRALAHPLRLRILHELNSKVSSPGRLSRELGEPLTNVSYHVKVLAENEAIELVRTEPVRGAVEHFYRATMRPHIDDDVFARLPASSRRAMALEGLETILAEIGAAAESHGFSDPRVHLSLTRLELDRQAIEELSDRLSELIELGLRLEAESRERVGDADAPAALEPTQLALLHFQQASPDRKRKKRTKRSKTQSA